MMASFDEPIIACRRCRLVLVFGSNIRHAVPMGFRAGSETRGFATLTTVRTAPYVQLSTVPQRTVVSLTASTV